MDAEPSIRCDDPDGPITRMRLVGGLSIALFGVGVPAGFAAVMWRHRAAIFVDQVRPARSVSGPPPATRSRRVLAAAAFACRALVLRLL
jgi:hypothetical protein